MPLGIRDAKCMCMPQSIMIIKSMNLSIHTKAVPLLLFIFFLYMYANHYLGNNLVSIFLIC